MLALALRRKRPPNLAEEKRRLSGGRQLREFTQTAQQLEQPQRTHQGLDAACLVQIKQRSHRGEGRARFQQVDENQPAHPARKPPAAGIRLNLRARILHHASISHAGRAGGFAAPAGQAEIDMLPVGFSDGRAGGHLHHLVDAPARRIHLEAEFAVRGAGIETQPAVDAAVQIELTGSETGLFKYGCRVFHGSEGSTDQTGS